MHIWPTHFKPLLGLCYWNFVTVFMVVTPGPLFSKVPRGQHPPSNSSFSQTEQKSWQKQNPETHFSLYPSSLLLFYLQGVPYSFLPSYSGAFTQGWECKMHFLWLTRLKELPTSSFFSPWPYTCQTHLPKGQDWLNPPFSPLHCSLLLTRPQKSFL